MFHVAKLLPVSGTISGRVVFWAASRCGSVPNGPIYFKWRPKCSTTVSRLTNSAGRFHCCAAHCRLFIIVHCLLCKFLFTILMHSTTIMAEDSKNHIKHTKNTHNYTQKHKTKRKITQKCIQYNKTIKTKKKTYRWNKAAPYGIFSLTYHTSWHKDKTLRNMIFVFMFPLFSRIWQRIAMNTLSPLHSQYTSSSLVHFQLFYVFYHFIIHFYCSFCPRCVLSSF